MTDKTIDFIYLFHFTAYDTLSKLLFFPLALSLKIKKRRIYLRTNRTKKDC